LCSGRGRPSSAATGTDGLVAVVVAAPRMTGMSIEQPDPGVLAAASPIDPATDPANWVPVEAPGPRCPWCSAALQTLDTPNCPICNAQLSGAADPGLPGLTVVAPPAKPAPVEMVKRNRLLAWISGEVLDEQANEGGPEAAPEALAPPSRDVRREILRIQLDAAGIELPLVVDDPDAPLTAPAASTADGAPAGESTAA